MPPIAIDSKKGLGRAGDYSMLLEMKRRQINVREYIANVAANAPLKNVGTKHTVQERPLGQSNTGPVRSVFQIRGAVRDFIAFS